MEKKNENNNNKKITMQYPYDSSNQLWDGQEHIIEPINITNRTKRKTIFYIDLL